MRDDGAGAAQSGSRRREAGLGGIPQPWFWGGRCDMGDDAGEALDALGARDESPEAIARMARNAASVADVPWEELPDGVARACLLEMAYAGGDVGTLRAADGRWWVRLGSRLESCATWAARFHM